MEHLNSAISVRHLSFDYKGVSIIKNVSIDIEAGKLTFILGQNGSGKTTFLKIIAGLLKPGEGFLKIFGNYCHRLSFRERSKLTGYLNQQHKAVFPFTVEDVVLTGRAGYINYMPQEDDRRASSLAMERTGILHLKNRNYTDLSGGEQQMVMISRLLAQNPKILLLDEPTAHLDFNNQSHLLNLLKQLVRDGLTIVAVLHDPNIAFLFGDDFLFVSEKNIIRSGDSLNAWDIEFLKEIYQGGIKAIPYDGRALLIPDVNCN